MLGPGSRVSGVAARYEAQSASFRWLLSLNTLDQRSLSLRMKASNSAGELATSRGYRLSDSEYESRAVMMFIEGCIMGRQR